MIKKILLTLFMLIIGVSCSQQESNVSSGNRLGILHWGNGAEPQGLDPHQVAGVPESNIITALLEGLVIKDAATLEITPGVATHWQISDDGTVYRFYIRDNARWSNGDPVTAEDFRWTYWRGMQPALGNKYSYMFNPIKNASQYMKGEINDFDQVGVKVIDRLTLEITLTNPTPYFLQMLDHYTYFPLHRPTIERFANADARSSQWTRPGNYVGNGAFQLTNWQLFKSIQVAKNPYYWDVQQVKLNGIHFYPTENLSTEERMFRAEQLHRTEVVPTNKIKIYQKQNPDLLKIAPYLGTYYYRFNVSEPPLDDKRVRKALNLAVDRKLLAEQVLQAGQIPSTIFTPPNTLGYTATSDLGFAPEQARELLAEAGYPDGKNFPTVTLLYNTHDDHRKIAVAIQQMWKKYLNIDLTINNQDWKVFLDSVQTGNYQISRAGWIGDYVDPNTFLELWVSNGGNNNTGWSNTRYDELILKLAPATLDREARYNLLYEAEAILLDEVPVLPIYTYTSKHLIHPSVKGLPGNILDHAVYKNISLDAEQSLHD